MSDAELGWVAGLLEGEGSFMLSRNGSSPKYKYPNVQMSSTDLDVLEKLRAITGLGGVYGPYPRKDAPNSKPIYQWRVISKSGARPLMEAVLPLMGRRRSAKIQEILDATS